MLWFWARLTNFILLFSFFIASEILTIERDIFKSLKCDTQKKKDDYEAGIKRMEENIDLRNRDLEIFETQITEEKQLEVQLLGLQGHLKCLELVENVKPHPAGTPSLSEQLKALEKKKAMSNKKKTKLEKKLKDLQNQIGANKRAGISEEVIDQLKKKLGKVIEEISKRREYETFVKGKRDQMLGDLESAIDQED